MVVLPDDSKPEAVLAVVVVFAAHHVDLELSVRDVELCVEIEALNPVIVIEVVG